MTPSGPSAARRFEVWSGAAAAIGPPATPRLGLRRTARRVRRLSATCRRRWGGIALPLMCNRNSRNPPVGSRESRMTFRFLTTPFLESLRLPSRCVAGATVGDDIGQGGCRTSPRDGRARHGRDRSARSWRHRRRWRRRDLGDNPRSSPPNLVLAAILVNIVATTDSMRPRHRRARRIERAAGPRSGPPGCRPHASSRASAPPIPTSSSAQPRRPGRGRAILPADPPARSVGFASARPARPTGRRRGRDGSKGGHA